MDLARAGEDCAAQWYSQRGYVVLARNWRCRAGEIDLVLISNCVIVISEVKTRSTTYFGSPSSAVDSDKQRRLRRLAVMWLAENRSSYRSIRFDVVEVLLGREGAEVNVIEGAF